MIVVPLAGLLLTCLATAAAGSRPEIFHRSGSMPDQAAAGARASTAAYEQRSGVDCVERTLVTAWNWDLEYWEADLLAVCDFG